MQYNVIGLMSGSSLDGLDIAFVHFEESAGKWQFDILETACISYSPEWRKDLASSGGLTAKDYLLLHTSYGHYLGNCINDFLEERNLSYKVQLISSHGHTAFHLPAQRMTAQLGDGASIAAVTGIRTITDLRSVDVALGGQGAPIVPIGEKLLFPEFNFFLNIGGIANLSAKGETFIGFDVCPANRVLNLLSSGLEKGFDENGAHAAAGRMNENLFNKLNSLSYYQLHYPKSLSNEFGLNDIFPIIKNANLSTQDSLRTYVEHIVFQISKSLIQLKNEISGKDDLRLLVTGGGAHNHFLTQRLREEISSVGIELVIPSHKLIDFKEALVMALMGTLRWREDINVIHTVTGASKDSINGAVWSV
ncbi:MAG TPA: anhydro-N-acetylmuramic acid kinase [Puia sp.]|nr:anhydro-N-acetylmuramic acid kinase [Puia sp.]